MESEYFIIYVRTQTSNWGSSIINISSFRIGLVIQNLNSVTTRPLNLRWTRLLDFIVVSSTKNRPSSKHSLNKNKEDMRSGSVWMISEVEMTMVWSKQTEVPVPQVLIREHASLRWSSCVASIMRDATRWFSVIITARAKRNTLTSCEVYYNSPIPINWIHHLGFVEKKEFVYA